MNRRGFLGGISMAGLIGPGMARAAFSPAFAPDHPLQESWRAWKALCLSSEGRVIDGFQQNASHSEGQGYGLTLAVQFGDIAAARSIIGWTDTNLAVRDDSLLAWRWLPDSEPHIPDRNNASDGDLFYAWALKQLTEITDDPAPLERAREIVADLIRLCQVPNPSGQGNLFLPGATGFVTETGAVVINPSYSMPRAMRELAEVTGQTALAELADDSLRMWSTLAQRGPVPDWVSVTDAGFTAPPQGFSTRSGYEAIRVPLFALWSGEWQNPAVTAYVEALRGAGPGDTPTAFDPASRQPLERSASPGYAAISALVDCVTTGGTGSLMPIFSDQQPYYPATLHLFSLVIQAQLYPRCVPI